MNELIIVLVVLLVLQDETPAYGPPSIPPSAPPPEASAHGAAPPAVHDPTDLGAFAPVLSLPGLAQVYSIEKPLYASTIAPITKALNQSAAVAAINHAFGDQQVTTTTNANGTINRQVKNPNWATRHFSEPISKAGTGAGHAIVSIFKSVF